MRYHTAFKFFSRVGLLLSAGLVGGCLQLLPSPLQEVGPALSSLFSRSTTHTYVVVGASGTIYTASSLTGLAQQNLPSGATNSLTDALRRLMRCAGCQAPAVAGARA